MVIDFGFGATADPTYQYTTTDTAAGLAAAKITKTLADGTVIKAKAVTIGVITNDIRIAFNAEPTQDDETKLGYEYSGGDLFTVQGYSNIAALQIISAATGTAGVLNITVFF